MSGIRNLLSLLVFAVATETVQRPGVIQKANVMYLSEEATNKDQSLKMRLLLLSDDKPSLDTELIWQQNGYFGNQRRELTLNKVNFPENTLIYTNQGSVLTLKCGEHAIYLDYVILGQLICAKRTRLSCTRPSTTLKQESLRASKNGWLTSWYKVMRMRCFCHMALMRTSLMSSIQATNKYCRSGTSMLLNERSVQEHSKMLFFLPSTTDRKEKIN